MGYKLASRAVSWYNEGLNKYGCLSDIASIPRLDERHRRSSMPKIISYDAVQRGLVACVGCGERYPQKKIESVLRDGFICTDCFRIGQYCPECKKFKKLAKFPKGTNKRGLCVYCAPCNRMRKRRYYKEVGKSEEARQYERRASLHRKYNISPEEYDHLFTLQHGLCAACGQPERLIDGRSGKIKMLSVDHCHTFGCVRGLLCYECNNALGLMHDDLQRIASLGEYLHNYKTFMNELM